MAFPLSKPAYYTGHTRERQENIHPHTLHAYDTMVSYSQDKGPYAIMGKRKREKGKKTVVPD
jgi:hypothetical protein